MSWWQRVVLRLIGVRITQHPTGARVTMPRKREAMLPKVVEKIRGEAWREGSNVTVRVEGDVTYVVGRTQTVEIRLV